MSPKQTKAPVVEDGVNDAETIKHGDQSPRFRKLTPDEQFKILMEPASDVPAHALDDAPPNSKVIVVLNREANQENGLPRRLAVMATPDGPVNLGGADPAARLPIGTKIYRTPENHFQLTLPDEYATERPLIGGRAADLIHLANQLVAGEVVLTPEAE